MSLAFDTHRYVKEFTEAGVPEKQAEITVKMFSDVLEERENVYKENLASRQDIKDVRQEIKDVRQEIKSLESTLKQEIKSLESTLKQEIKENINSLIKWLVPLLMAQSGLIVALMKFFEK